MGKKNTMQKIGKGIKDTFIEMSESLAGWIDDASTQFSGQSGRTKTQSKQPTKQPTKKKSSHKQTTRKCH